MTNVTSSVTLAVDSSQVKAADAALDGFAAAGAKAETAATALERAAKGSAAAFAATATGTGAALSATQRQATASRTAADGLKAQGQQTKMTGQQTAQLSAQLQDLFVQIQAGGSPLTALIQQGSQLSAVFGGIGPAVRAVLSVFTAARVAALGAAGGALALGAAFVAGRDQSVDFQRSLVLTRGAAGLTEGAFNRLAKSTAELTKTTVGSTRETLQALAGSGRFDSKNISEAAAATQLLAKVTGQSADAIVSDFTRAADAPTKFAEQLNKQFNLFNVEQLTAIRTAEDQGRAQDALGLVLRALNGRLGEAAKNVGVLESAYGALARTVSSAKDALLGVGRQATVDDEIKRISGELAAARETLAEYRKPGGGLIDIFLGNRAEEKIKQLEPLLAKLRESRDLAEQGASADAASVQRQQAALAFDRLKEQGLARQEQLTKALADANALADRAGASQTDRAQVLLQIVKQFDDGSRGAQIEANVSAVERALGREVGAFRNAESALDALRSAGKVSDGDYYAAKQAFIDANARAQIKALEAESALLARQQVSGADKIRLDTRLAENASRVAAIRAQAAAEGLVLSVQESSAADAMKRAYTEAQIAAQAYLDTLSLAQQRDLGGIGQGAAERDRARARQQIEDRYRQERQRLEGLKRTAPLLAQEYDRQLADLEVFQRKALESYDDYYAKRMEKEAQFSTGASAALANYQESARNTAALAETAFSNAFRGAEDALVQFVTTGKANFKSFAQSILADLARIQIRQGLAQLLSSFSFGGGFSTNNTGGQLPTAGGRAIGGPVSRFSVHPVLEKGQPEVVTTNGKSYLMTGSQPGQVTPMQPAEPAVSISINVAGDVTPKVAQLAASLVQQAIVRERRARAWGGAGA